MDYQNGKIYKIINDIDDEIYVGSTCQLLCQRMGCHRTHAQNSQLNGKIYQKMRGDGIEHFQIVLVEVYPCNSKDELRAREEYWRVELCADLNQRMAHTPLKGKEYFQDHYQKNKTTINERNNKYYHDNHEYFLEQKREYNKANKTEINRKNREYQEIHKEEIAQKQKVLELCECGLTYTHIHKQRHLRSEQHKWYKEMNQNPDQEEYLLCDCGMYLKEGKEIDFINHQKCALHKKRMELLETIEI